MLRSLPMDVVEFPEFFYSDRLIFRKLKYEDAEEIFYSYASKPAATTYVIWPTHQSIKDTRKFLKIAIDAWAVGLAYNFAIREKHTGRLIGSVGINVQENELQFGYIFSPANWRMGYATETVTILKGYMLANNNINRIHTVVDADNLASIRVLDKTGFRVTERIAAHLPFVNQGNRLKDCLIYEWPF